jgi:hypothetical protein
VGNVTSNDGPISMRGNLRPEQLEATMLLNARVHAEPDRLRGIVENSLKLAAGDRLKTAIDQLRCFPPGRPQPTYRYESVV